MPNEELKSALKEIAVKVVSSPQVEAVTREVIANIQGKLQDKLNEVMMPKRSAKKKTTHRSAKKKTTHKTRTITIHESHMAALEDCADILDELLQGPMTPGLIENAQEAIEALEEFGEEADEDEEDPDSDDPDEDERHP